MPQKPTCYIVSLKYVPGLWKEFHLLGKHLREHGFPVKYLISNGYDWQAGGTEEDIIFVSSSRNLKEMIADMVRYPFSIGQRVAEAFRSAPPIFLCAYNPHPLNILVARYLRRSVPDAKVVLFLHEPYEPAKLACGMVHAVYLALVETVQSLTLRYCTNVLVPSLVALRRFQEKYAQYHGSVRAVNLLIPDEYHGPVKRTHFSIIGHASCRTGHDLFVQLVNYTAKHALPFSFAIVSSSNIRWLLKELTTGGKRILKVVNKPVIHDNEINQIVASSYAVFRLDRKITQSGVTPVAYMNGTPVIVTDEEGLVQHVQDGVNGCIVHLNGEIKPLIEAMHFVQRNIRSMAQNARKSYETHFSERCWMRFYQEFL